MTIKTTTVCDRCGAEIGFPPDGWVIGTGKPDAVLPERRYDICPVCFSAFDAWLAQPTIAAADPKRLKR